MSRRAMADLQVTCLLGRDFHPGTALMLPLPICDGPFCVDVDGRLISVKSRDWMKLTSFIICLLSGLFLSQFHRSIQFFERGIVHSKKIRKKSKKSKDFFEDVSKE